MVTYNVLNPSLCTSHSYPHCDPAQIDERLRLTRILERLDRAIAASPYATVLCLQEVNEAWACRLHAHFQPRGYHLIYAPTPWYAYDPMGVCLVWSNSAFDLQDAEVRRVVEPGQSTAPAPPPSWWSWLKGRAAAVLGGTAPEVDPWTIARRRPNRYAAARLRFRCSGQQVCVATYHMPALFGSALLEQVMAVHAAAVAGLARRFAGEQPLVLAGDFNVQPGAPAHSLLEGSVALGQIVPEPLPAGGSTPSAEEGASPRQRLRSAYQEGHGAEPAFTIRSWRADAESPFVGTLDYIFVGDDIRVMGAVDLPCAAQFADSDAFPSAEEPSDHLLLAADLAVGCAE